MDHCVSPRRVSFCVSQGFLTHLPWVMQPNPDMPHRAEFSVNELGHGHHFLLIKDRGEVSFSLLYLARNLRMAKKGGVLTEVECWDSDQRLQLQQIQVLLATFWPDGKPLSLFCDTTCSFGHWLVYAHLRLQSPWYSATSRKKAWEDSSPCLRHRGKASMAVHHSLPSDVLLMDWPLA